ncbi:MAG TPA: DinB family protein [Chloroflexia bacterium]|nr:DinB family protein [Chloroflexia bacterium]
MNDLRSQDVDELARRFFSGESPVNEATHDYPRGELCRYMLEKIDEIEAVVGTLSPEQLAYRPPGAPSGPDASGDEAHFNISEIVTHLASGIAFHWWGITRALKHERPQFPSAPEGAKVTGTKGTVMGGGGWSGVGGPELIRSLREITAKFISYVQSLPEDQDLSATSSMGPFRNLTPHSWLFLDAVHFGMHLNQIRTIKAMPDFPK